MLTKKTACTITINRVKTYQPCFNSIYIVIVPAASKFIIMLIYLLSLEHQRNIKSHDRKCRRQDCFD